MQATNRRLSIDDSYLEETQVLEETQLLNASQSSTASKVNKALPQPPALPPSRSDKSPRFGTQRMNTSNRSKQRSSEEEKDTTISSSPSGESAVASATKVKEVSAVALRGRSSRADAKLTESAVSPASSHAEKKVAATSKKSPSIEETPQLELSPAELRFRFAKIPLEGEPQGHVFKLALYHLHELCRALINCEKHKQIGKDFIRYMQEYKKKMKFFKSDILPQVKQSPMQKIEGLHEQTEVLQGNGITIQEICRTFAGVPVKMNEQVDAIDTALYHLQLVGGEIIKASNGAANRIDSTMKDFEFNVRSRLKSLVYEIRLQMEIQKSEKLMKKNLLEQINDLFKEVLFIDFAEYIDSKNNQQKLLSLSSEFKELFKKMKSVKDRCVACEDLEKKLDLDYELTECSVKICETYVSSLRQFCEEFSKPLQPAFVAIKKRIDKIITDLLKEAWSTHNSTESQVRKDCLEEILTLIKHRYLPGFIKGMHKKHQSQFATNLRETRPVINSRLRQKQEDDLLIFTFHESLDHLKKKLLHGRLSPPTDLPRMLGPDGSATCWIEGNNVEPETSSPAGRYQVLLRTFSSLFDDPRMFLFLPRIMGFPVDASVDTGTFTQQYCEAYSRYFACNAKDLISFKEPSREDLESLQDFVDIKANQKELLKQLKKNKKAEKILPESDLRQIEELEELSRLTKLKSLLELQEIKNQFEGEYGDSSFEKVFNCFHLCQKIFGQSILYYFNHRLAVARFGLFKEKSNIERMGLKKITQAKFIKSKFEIKVEGKNCRIEITRYDALVNDAVHLRQQYSILLNPDFLDVNFSNVDLSLEYPSYLANDAEIQKLLFELPLAMRALDFPELTVTCKK